MITGKRSANQEVEKHVTHWLGYGSVELVPVSDAVMDWDCIHELIL